MGCGHLLIITIFLVNGQIVSPGHGLDYIRGMGRDDRHPLCGEIGTESSAPNLHPPSAVTKDPLMFPYPLRGNIDLPQYLLTQGTAHELAC